MQSPLTDVQNYTTCYFYMEKGTQKGTLLLYCDAPRQWKEGNALFNDALNTFYLRLYGVRHMVKDHSDSEKGNPLPPHGLLFPINSKFFFIFYMHHPTDIIGHTTAFVTPVVDHWLERKIVQWVHPHEGSLRRPIAPWANALTTELHFATPVKVSNYVSVVLLIPCSTNIFRRFYLIKSVCRNVERKGKVFWK